VFKLEKRGEYQLKVNEIFSFYLKNNIVCLFDLAYHNKLSNAAKAILLGIIE